jgi:hypothetical protein
MEPQEVAKVQDAERELCCRAICRECAAGVPVEYDEETGEWWHRYAEHPASDCRCAAASIRMLSR